MKARFKYTKIDLSRTEMDFIDYAMRHYEDEPLACGIRMKLLHAVTELNHSHNENEKRESMCRESTKSVNTKR